MAPKHFLYFFSVLFFIKQTKNLAVHFNMPEIEEKDFDLRSHLKYQSVWEYCLQRQNACRSNNSNICAAKLVNKKKFYKDFVNGCYLFMSNMCDHPEEEYFIVTSGSCDEYLALRRNGDESQSNELTDTGDIGARNDSSTEFNVDENLNETEIEGLRQGISTLYDIDTAYDNHPCPFSCPKIYEPICLNINRGSGKYFKMLSFVNHCSADLYYCKNWQEFMPPPNEPENVKSSPLSWSFCGASR